jgi:hypothetical protein
MINFEIFFRPSLIGIKVGRDKQLKFYGDSLNRLKQNVTNGAPFGDLVAPTETAYTNLRDNRADANSSYAQQQGKTITVDNVIATFKTTVSKREAAVRVNLDKETAGYQEFFPLGLTQYSKITKATAYTLMSQFIVAAQNNVSVTGQALLDEFTLLRTDFVKARDRQEEVKGATDDKRTVWDVNSEIMKDQIHYNALTIAREYRGHPEKAGVYFDQTILRLKEYTNGGVKPLSEQVAPLATLTPVMKFTATDTILLSNVSTDASIFWYGGNTINEAPTTAPTELLPGEEIEIPANTLGNYLILLNKDVANTAEVEIMLV